MEDRSPRAQAETLNDAERRAVLASAVLVPSYRDMGRMERRLLELRLARLTPAGAVLTRQGKAVRAYLQGRQ